MVNVWINLCWGYSPLVVGYSTHYCLVYLWFRVCFQWKVYISIVCLHWKLSTVCLQCHSIDYWYSYRRARFASIFYTELSLNPQLLPPANCCHCFHYIDMESEVCRWMVSSNSSNRPALIKCELITTTL